MLSGPGSGLNEGLTLKGIGRSITDWLESRSGNEPFYMQIGSKETHREWSLYSKPYKGKGCWKAPYLIDSTDVGREMAEMQGAVRALDMGLGEVRDAFDSAGLEDDTIFIITSDHGIEVPPKTDGITVLPLLTGKGEYHPRNALFFEKTYHDNYDPIRGLRTERYKYVMNFDAQKLYDVRIATAPRYNWFRQSINKYTAEELYDLESDANEEKNLAKNPEYRDILLELRKCLADWMNSTEDPLLDGPVPSPYHIKMSAMMKKLGKTGR